MHLAILDATGAWALSCLHQALESEQVDKITVLVRTPSKLTSLLEKRNVRDTTKMHVIQGDAKEVEDVKKVIQKQLMSLFLELVHPRFFHPVYPSRTFPNTFKHLNLFSSLSLLIPCIF